MQHFSDRIPYSGKIIEYHYIAYDLEKIQGNLCLLTAYVIFYILSHINILKVVIYKTRFYYFWCYKANDLRKSSLYKHDHLCVCLYLCTKKHIKFSKNNGALNFKINRSISVFSFWSVVRIYKDFTNFNRVR